MKFRSLDEMACKTVTHEARHLNARVNQNDLFIPNSAEFPNSELDIGFGKGRLPENLGSNCTNLMRMY